MVNGSNRVMSWRFWSITLNRACDRTLAVVLTVKSQLPETIGIERDMLLLIFMRVSIPVAAYCSFDVFV